MSLGEGMRLAVGTFTRSPSGRVTITPDTARTALLFAPFAVLPLALPVVLVGLVLVAEVVLTAVFLWVILGVTSKKAPPGSLRWPSA